MNACVIFDLDDTLIDTRNVLLPLAMERVSRAIGVPVDRLNDRGKKIDELLAPVAGLSEAQRASAAAAWYKPEVPPLEPLPGARELLERLRGRVRLFLLTRGDPARQQAKVARCGLGRYFEDVVIRPIDSPGSKRDDIEAILERTQIPPDRCAVVGDDPADELRFAEELGCKAIRVPETRLSDVAETLVSAGLLSVS